MEVLNSVIKIVFLGIQGVGMPATLLVYVVWSAVKDSGKIGLSLYTGHFLAEIIILFLAFFTGNFSQNSVFSTVVYFFSAVICLLYAVKLSILAFKDIKLLAPFEITKKDVVKYEQQYTDIYKLDEKQKNDIANEIKNDAKQRKLSKAKKSAFIASFLFTISSLSIITFFSSSIPSLIFHTNLSFGINNYPVATILFTVIFMFSEFILYFFLPKLISIFGKFTNETLVKILTAICAMLFFINTAKQASAMVAQLKFM